MAVVAVLRGEQPRHIPLGVYAVDRDLASRILGRKTLVRDKVAQQVMLWEDRRDELAESVRTMAAAVAARHRSQDGAWLDRGLDAAFVEEDFATSRGTVLVPASQPSVG